MISFAVSRYQADCGIEPPRAPVPSGAIQSRRAAIRQRKRSVRRWPGDSAAIGKYSWWPVRRQHLFLHLRCSACRLTPCGLASWQDL